MSQQPQYRLRLDAAKTYFHTGVSWSTSDRDAELFPSMDAAESFRRSNSLTAARVRVEPVR